MDGYDCAAIARPAQKASRPRSMASAAVGNFPDRAAITSGTVTGPSRPTHDRAPIDDGVPQHALIAAIEIPVQRVEVEGDHVSLADRHVENGRTADEVLFPPGLAAHDEWRALPVAPLEHDAAAIDGSIETDRAVGHAQPAPRHRVEREVLPEHPG